MGENNWGIWALLIALAAIFAMFGYTMYHFYKPKKESDFVTGPKPVVIKRAQAVDKRAELIKTGTSRMPSHKTDYVVKFRFFDGSEEWQAVPPEAYARILPGMQGDLVTQDGSFLDFADLFSEPVREDNKE